ncbi:MAG: SPFH domain-containing protein [Myxococcaceae bacterium]|jgi:uncharacterized membrane protein YqiK|nr:SPFH domain-containing protein [Myxococcaceae bacterium]
MSPVLVSIAVAVVLLLLLVGGLFLLVRRVFVTVPSGFALVVHTPSGVPRVSFTGAVVLPGVHRTELLDLRERTTRIDRSPANTLVTKEGASLCLTATFTFQVSRSPDAIAKVLQRLGAARANDDAALDQHVRPRLEQALEVSANATTAEALFADRTAFRDDVLLAVGAHLDEGFEVTDLVLTDLRRADG